MDKTLTLAQKKLALLSGSVLLLGIPELILFNLKVPDIWSWWFAIATVVCAFFCGLGLISHSDNPLKLVVIFDMAWIALAALGIAGSASAFKHQYLLQDKSRIEFLLKEFVEPKVSEKAKNCKSKLNLNTATSASEKLLLTELTEYENRRFVRILLKSSMFLGNATADKNLSDIARVCVNEISNAADDYEKTREELSIAERLADDSQLPFDLKFFGPLLLSYALGFRLAKAEFDRRRAWNPAKHIF